VETLLTDRRMHSILANMESASAHLDATVVEMRRKMDAAEIKTVIADISQTLSEARDFVQSARREIEGMKVAQQAEKAGQVFDTLAKETEKTGEKAREMLGALDKSVDTVSVELMDTAENLRMTSETLQSLAENLKGNPSELLFGRPAPPKKDME
jgi:paraquat-inducible protein B